VVWQNAYMQGIALFLELTKPRLRRYLDLEIVGLLLGKKFKQATAQSSSFPRANDLLYLVCATPS